MNFLLKPGLWAIVYFLTMFGFAFIYSNMPGQFYHSTIQYEATILRDQSDLKREFIKEVLENYKRVHGNSYLKYSGIDVDPNSFQVDTFRFFASEDIFKTEFSFQRIENGFHTGPIIFMHVYLSTDAHDARDSSHLPYCYFYFGGNDNNAQFLSYNEAQFFCNLIPDYANQVNHLMPSTNNLHSPAWIYLPISWTLAKKFEAYKKVVLGFSSETSSGQYWRMFYFSAVTMTTIGYGDIVPISNRARNLIALETIIGVIAVGMFLNGIAKKY